MYGYSDRKQKSKVHILDINLNSLCHVENCGTSIPIKSEFCPEDKTLCGICLHMLKKANKNEKSLTQKVKRLKKTKKKRKRGGPKEKSFYSTREWKELRYQAFLKYPRKCIVCGATEETATLVVDHIKPIWKYPELKLDLDNLQIMCNDCNWGKGGWDQTNWKTRVSDGVELNILAEARERI